MYDFSLIRRIRHGEGEDLWELVCGCVVHVRRRLPGSYAAWLERDPRCTRHRKRVLREPEEALEVRRAAP